MEINNEGTLRKSIQAGKWMFINTIFQNAISFISFLVLARLLIPKDFGIISLLFVVPNLLSLVTTFGFNSALIQRNEDPKKYLNETWTFNILRAIVIFIIIFFLAPLIANFFHIKEYVWAVRLSGVFILITSFANAAQIYFFKEIDFKKIFIRDVLGSIFYTIISISFALFYKSFWPLFLGQMGKYLSIVIATYFLHEYRPRLSFDFKKLKTLINYSKWIFGQNIIINAIPAIENGLLGKFTSTTGVGLYSRAKSLSSIPSGSLFNIFDKVTYPAYSKIQNAYGKIQDGFIKSLDLLFFISIPIIFLIFEEGHRIVLVFLGENWIGLVVLLKVLLLATTFNTLNVMSGPIFNAVGKPKIQFFINTINIVTLFSLFLLLTPYYGINGAATAFLINSIIIFLVSFYFLRKILLIGVLKISKTLPIPLISSLIIVGMGKSFMTLFDLGNAAFVAMVILLGAIYLAITALFGIFFKAGPYSTLKLIIAEVFSTSPSSDNKIRKQNN